MKPLQTLYFSLLLVVFLYSCGNNSENNGTTNFDKKQFLSNLAEKAILPAYANLESEATKFYDFVLTFEKQANAANLQNLQIQFAKLYKVWQSASLYEFGPAENVLLRANLNTFPSSKTIIEANIRSGNVNLDMASNLSAKGLPAIDYLLFNNLDSNENAFVVLLAEKKRLDYLKLIANDVLTKVKKVNTDWKNTYFAQFTQSTGTDAGSSLSLFINQFNFDYEILKTPKIGIPAGIKSLGIPQPDKCEALYMSRSRLFTKMSNELSAAQLLNFKNIFEGNYGNKNLSLKAYLDAINAKKGDLLLSDAIIAQLVVAENMLKLVDKNFETAAMENDGKMAKVYEELQKGVVLLKTDMPSNLGVQITYQDADGD